MLVDKQFISQNFVYSLFSFPLPNFPFLTTSRSPSKDYIAIEIVGEVTVVDSANRQSMPRWKALFLLSRLLQGALRTARNASVLRRPL